MGTTVFLVRHGATDWHEAKRVLGQRDLHLSAKGVEQADTVARLLATTSVRDVISSPLHRALETAERIASHHNLQPARDARLTDFQVGKWAGMTHEEVAEEPAYQRFLANPASEEIPGGETLLDVRTRASQAVDQAVNDSGGKGTLAIVTHAGVIRVLLTHYLGSAPGNYHLLRVSRGSVSILHFSAPGAVPRVLAVNHGSTLQQVIEV